MSRGDVIGLVASYVCAFGLLGAVEAIRTWRGWPQDFTRKLVHIGAGMWVWGVLWLFDDWRWGLVPFATFIVLNYVFYRRQTFKAMDAADSSPGTVYFALSITVLFALLWRKGEAGDRAPIAVAAVMAMTWGDAFAAIVGRNWGRRTYHAFGRSTRTLEGSAAMALFSLDAIALTLLILPGSALSPTSAPLGPAAIALHAVAGAAVATLAEALSPAGTDNLSVPLATALALYLLAR
ncbi:MAG TPA: phosphatidate cytidylyltransferase [Anaerolineae bacterium]|nr:phosphatidate cytidylyltransferase [Anaerolineae bacterium]